MTPTSPTEILELLSQGRDAYLRQDWDAALAFDERALALTTPGSDAWTQALCHRFVGLCHYRRGGAEALGRSLGHLRKSIELAGRAGATKLRLSVSNHLGATLRDLGRHDEAYDLFRASLREAVGPELVEVRARLLGNLGALLDELDQRASADDCYARYEELVEQFDDPRRLANARALAGRAALLRGDLEEADWRFTDELKWGDRLDDQRRRCSAFKHRGELAIARLEQEPSASAERVARLTVEAEESLDAAWAASDRVGDRKVRIRIAVKRAEFMRKRGRIAEAHAVLGEVASLSAALDHAVLASKLDHERAKVCSAAGLHGEALWYLSQAARRRVSLIRNLKSERVRTMARAWLDGVRAMATDLRAEAFLLPRDDAERTQFETLFAEIGDALRDDPCPISAGVEIDPWRWHDQLRAQSKERWSLILGDDFRHLHPESQNDLVRADVTYHGAVDDLGRSAHLLAIALERELRERVVVPFRSVVRDNPGVFRRKADWAGFFEPDEMLSLTKLLKMIGQVGRLSERTYFEKPRGRAALEGLAPIVTLSRNIPSVSGRTFNLVDVRNDVAHGRSPSTSLDRVAVDAIKRALTLDAPVVLKGLLKWPLTP